MSLEPGSTYYKEQIEAELFKLRVRREARLALDADESARVAVLPVEGPSLIYAPLPPDSPELIPNLIPQSGTACIVGETETGKAQPLDAKVLTPTGWKLMGDLRVGDALASHDGQESRVLAIHPRGERQVYRVTFCDGRSTETCGEHLWRLNQANWERPDISSGKRIGPKRRVGPRLMTTDQISKFSKSTLDRVFVDLPEKLEFGVSSPLPIDPWLLGMFLGDGSISQEATQFTTADQEIVDRAAASVGPGLSIRKLSSKFAYSVALTDGCTRLGHSGSLPNPLKEALKSLGLMGCHSYEKFIPECYMESPREVREQLICGLMDTDGYVQVNGCMSFTTTSPMLAEQVATLVRSVGGLCRTTLKYPFFKDKNGNRKEGRLAYNLWISSRIPSRLVSLTRKLDRLPKDKWRRRLLKFTSIVPSRIVETQCITVSHPDGLYITDDFIVTHNSLIACEIASSLVTGSALWGSIIPNKVLRKVVYILGEHTCQTVQGLFHRTGLPHEGNIQLIGPEHLHPFKALVVGGIQQKTAVERLIRWTEGAELIIFDPLAGFVQGLTAENDNATMRTLVDSISLVAVKNNSACLVLNHMGKPLMDNTGHEVRRQTYASRGATSVEDAMTHIFYLRRSSVVRQQGPEEKFELSIRKFKGNPSDDTFKLVRDPLTKRNTLIQSSKSTYPTLTEKIALVDKINRLREANPGFTDDTCLKIVASTENIPKETLQRWLTQV